MQLKKPLPPHFEKKRKISKTFVRKGIAFQSGLGASSAFRKFTNLSTKLGGLF